MPKSLKLVLIAVWAVTVLAVGGGLAAVKLMRHADVSTADAGHAGPAEPAGKPLPVLFDAAPFQLTDAAGQPFDSAALAGRVWVADFVFTHCTSFCPQMTAGLSDVQQRTVGLPLQLVSFTVDPDRDTPAVLSEYAALHRADPARWHFLTGTQPQMWAVSTAMKLAVGPGDTAMQVMHSSHYLLVDRRGHVRGIYDFKDPGYVERIVTDAKRLMTE